MSKVILISGGTRGIGRAISEALLASGHHVATFCPFPGEVKSFGEAAVKICDPKKILILEGDVTSEADVAEMVKRTIDCFGRIDVLINNAGMTYYHESDTADMVKVRRMLEVNLIGAMMLTKEVVPIMKKQGGGQIIMTVSTSGRHVTARGEFYGASKYGLMGYAQGIRAELRPFGIKVATVCPGITNTDAVDPAELAKREPGEQVMLDPTEVARAFSFIVDQPATSDIRDLMVTPTGSTRYHF